MIEMALVLTVGMMVLFVTIQFAMIGNAALAVTELAYAGARYASVNPSFDGAAVSNYMQSIASPTILTDNGADLSIALNYPAVSQPPASSGCTASAASGTTPRTFGTPFSVTVYYNLKWWLFLPNPFLGMNLPSCLTSTQTLMSE